MAEYTKKGERLSISGRVGRRIPDPLPPLEEPEGNELEVKVITKQPEVGSADFSTYEIEVMEKKGDFNWETPRDKKLIKRKTGRSHSHKKSRSYSRYD